MSLLNQNKGKKKGDKKKNQNANAQGSRFIQKPQNNTFVSKQQNTGSQRGS
jgi:ribosomal protein S11